MADTEVSEVWLGMFAPRLEGLRCSQADYGWGEGGHRSSEATLTVCKQHLPAGRAGLGKLLSLTSSNGVKILRQTLRVNCQIMSSTSPSSTRSHCQCLSDHLP